MSLRIIGYFVSFLTIFALLGCVNLYYPTRESGYFDANGVYRPYPNTRNMQVDQLYSSNTSVD